MPMTADARPGDQGPSAQAFAQLCDLLAMQIACARDGDLTRVEQLCARADVLVMRLNEPGANNDAPASQRARLQRLYEELVLTLEAEHADVGTRLRQLRQVKRAVVAYGGKARP